MNLKEVFGLLNEYKKVLSQLNRFSQIMKKEPRDSQCFIDASSRSDQLIYGHLLPQDYGIIVQGLHRRLINKDFAKVIVAFRHNQSVAGALNLPASVSMTLELRLYQRKTGLSQSAFAKRYHIGQSQLSKMESGHQMVDVDFFQRILRSLNQKFVIA